MNSIVSTAFSKTVILVTGASRSGKSEWGESLARKTGLEIVYVATAIAKQSDREWQNRILKHQQRRLRTWQTIAEPYKLSWVIRNSIVGQCLLVDSLGSWVANFIELSDRTWQKITDNLLESITQSPSSIIFVGEETGWGVVPAYKSGRLFRDRLGYLSRQMGNKADTVYLVTGGHAVNLSILGTAIDK